MNETGLKMSERITILHSVVMVVTTGLAAGALSGCINVSAPDKPIEINLNVNAKQEVVVRLQRDAQEFITENPELFPQ